MQREVPRWPFTLDQDKAVESVLYLIPKLREPTLHSVSKVLYHADKSHLSRYGRPVTGDWYVAMKFGPVPSATYDLMKALRGDSDFPITDRARSAFQVVDDYKLIASRQADESVLSRSERDALTDAAAQHGRKTFNELTEESHGPAWEAADDSGMIRLESMLLEIDNRDELRDHFLEDAD